MIRFEYKFPLEQPPKYYIIGDGKRIGTCNAQGQAEPLELTSAIQQPLHNWLEKKTRIKSSSASIKCCLIDLDGTLADSLPALWLAYKEFMTASRLPATQEDFYGFMGPSLYEVFQQLQAKYKFEHDPQELALKYQEDLIDQYAKHIPLMPGAKEALESLAQSKELAVVTSAPAKIAWAFLDLHRITPLFSTVFTSEGLPRSKPDPEIYLRALAAMGYPAEETLAIEDSPAGIQSAVNAGLKTFWLTKETAQPTTAQVESFPNWLAIAQRMFSAV